MGFAEKFEWIFTNQLRLRLIIIMKTNVKFALLWLVFVVGSFIHDFFPFPQSYFSDSKNFLNVYFVKIGWGWTSGLLLLYITCTLIKQNVNNTKTYWKHYSRIIVYTIAWYICTTFFEYIETLTGTCLGDDAVLAVQSCRKHGYLWNGFDISGHCFLLTFCVLNINKELNGTLNLKIEQDNESYEEDDRKSKVDFKQIAGYAINTEYVNICYDVCVNALLILMVLWEIMLFFTCVYFHTLLQKLLGMLFGVAVTYICHKIFNMNHPMLPTSVKLIHSKKQS